MAKNNWQSCILGALDGLIFVGAARLVRFYFDYVERAAAQDSSGSTYYVNVANHLENWLGVTFLVIAMFMIAAYGVRRYWSLSWRHHLITWLLIGIAAMTAWNIFALAVSIWERRSSGQALISEGITSPWNPLYGPLSFGLVLLVNLVYGPIVGVLSKKHQ